MSTEQNRQWARELENRFRRPGDQKNPPRLELDDEKITRRVHRLLSSSKRVGLICQMNPRRIGVLPFVVFLEHRFFPPGTDLNEQFQLVLTKFEGMEYALIIIPRDRIQEADELAKTLGLRRADGIPHVIVIEAGAMRTKKFPFDYRTAYTMENLPGHFTYENNPAQYQVAILAEDKRLAEYRK